MFKKKKKKKQRQKTLLSLVYNSSDTFFFNGISLHGHFSSNGLGGMLAPVLAYQYFTVLVP